MNEVDNYVVNNNIFIGIFSYVKIKRVFDILFGILGILALIPVSFVVLVINFFNKDYAPIIYTQTRIGKDGKEFKLYKFRSMVPNADEVLKEVIK